MAIFCIVLGSVFIALFTLLGLGGAYYAVGVQILGQSLIDFLVLPNQLTVYLLVGGLGLFIGIVSGVPLIMHGIILRRLDAIEYLLACDVGEDGFNEDDVEPEQEEPAFEEVEDPDFDKPEEPETVESPAQTSDTKKFKKKKA